ncbi:MAG TPA: LytTR family DNA-binding domain-containing protein [Povalibacter sp.]|uniref:LytR/AlgR family response regulator transcription factor n=1 Tax=Povalibacter sp. TaxID=1962978 RepID=UPI002C1A2936|nr:LytTR family DNA-binding domain-containing protein [Povalibacter sp.]HMN47354.1 LytTR family DNA-binding domain-containing protein [Povalibacter sp.]
MKIRTLIIDDEEAARSRLRKLLAPFERIDIIGEARDGLEAIESMASMSADLVFLDVQMPGCDGFEALRNLPAGTSWPLVIFATAYDQYALDAFAANAVGYLLKPIDRGKLASVLERVERLHGSAQDNAAEKSRVHALVHSTRTELKHVVARFRDRYVLIPLDDVCVFKMEDGLVKVQTTTQLYRTDYNLADLEARLTDPPFFRAHRSAIVNSKKIAEVAPLIKGSYMLVLNDKERTEIQVSERQSKLVRELLQLRKG